MSRKYKNLGLLGAIGFTMVAVAAVSPAVAAPLPVVSACTGASLPPSRLTQVLTPLTNGIFTTLDPFFVPSPLLGNLLTGVPGIVSGAVSGAPIGLDVLTTTGQALAPGSACSQQAGGFTLSTPQGITIGGNSIDGLGATGLNASAGEIGSIALGNRALTAAAATNSIALGTGATVAGTSPNAIAIGNGASASTAGGVALGGSSIDKAATPTGGATINGAAYVFAGASPASVVSVGAAGAERQIANVAAGQISAMSTDAVNGSELFATNTALNSVGALAGNSVQYDSPGHTSVTLGGVGAATTVPLNNVAPAALTAGSTGAVNGGQINTVGASVAANLGGGSTFNTSTGMVTAPSYTVANIGPGGVVGTPIIDTTVGAAIGGLSTDVTNLGSGVNAGAIGPVQRTQTANQLTLVAAGGSGAAPGAAQNLTNVASGALTAGSTDAVNGSQLFATNQNITNVLSGKAGAFVSDNTAGAPNAIASGANSAAGGFGASATGAGSTILGNGATDNGIANATVLGNGASVAAGVGGSNVALGQGSAVTAAATPTPTGAIAGTTYNFAGGAPIGTVSVGGAAGQRQVQNVAAGQLSAGSTDAVNGSQLYATNTAIGSLVTGLGGIGTTNGSGGTAVGTGSSTAPAATNGIALGAGAATTVAGGVALGAGSTAATGPGVASYVPAVANATDVAAIAATNSTAGGVSVGSPATGVLRQINGVAGGTAPTDAANVAQVHAVADAVQVGALGPVQYSTPAAPTTPNGGVITNDLTLLGTAPGSQVTLHNLAPGNASSDAATVGQVTAGMNSAVATSNAYTNQVAGVLLNNIHNVARQAYSGVAAAMAVESAPYVTGKWTYAAGVGYYNDEAAIGASLRRTSDSGRWSVTAGISGGTYGGVAARVGVAGVLN